MANLVANGLLGIVVFTTPIPAPAQSSEPPPRPAPAPAPAPPPGGQTQERQTQRVCQNGYANNGTSCVRIKADQCLDILARRAAPPDYTSLRYATVFQQCGRDRFFGANGVCRPFTQQERRALANQCADIRVPPN